MRLPSTAIYLSLLTSLIGCLGALNPAAAEEAASSEPEQASVAQSDPGLAEAEPAAPVVDNNFGHASTRSSDLIVESAEEDTASNTAPTTSAQSGAGAELEINSEESDPANVGGNTIEPDLLEEVAQDIPEVAPQPSEADEEPDLIDEEGALEIQLNPVGKPRIPADKRTKLTLEGEITDSTGTLIEQDAIVTLTTTSGNFEGDDYDLDQPGFQVLATQGQFKVELRSSLSTQKVQVRAVVGETGIKVGDKPKYPQFEPGFREITARAETTTNIEFTTPLRPSLVTGVLNLRIGEPGTDFLGSFRNFLHPDNINDDIAADVDASLFATGQIGEWLFTGAFNSDRGLNERCDGSDRLFRDVQSCDQKHHVYGDSSTSDFLTPSIDNVYFRIQRDAKLPGAEADYFMWGDYNTEEFARSSQLFSATTRQLHGFKANYNLGKLQLTGLFANNIENFQRDTLAPDGTSGYYFLSKRLVVAGSENIYLEKEEIFRPGTVVERTQLFRGPDYEIDYDRGAILFRSPVPSVTGDAFGKTMVQRIVVTYQAEGSNDSGLFAGRAQYNFAHGFADKASWAGATVLREDQGDVDFTLIGADFRFPLGEKGEVIGEIAHSDLKVSGGDNIGGDAIRFEAHGEITEGIRGRAYYRAVDSGFRNDATSSFTPGQTRFGGQLAARLDSHTQVRLQYDEEENYGRPPVSPADLLAPGVQPILNSALLDNTLRTIRAGIVQTIDSSTVALDWTHRSRTNNLTGQDFESNQVVSRVSTPIAKDLTFQLQNELNLGGDDDPLYPDRTAVGLNWAAYPGVNIQLTHQMFSGGDFNDNNLTTLNTTFTRNIADNTEITGRYSVIGGFNEVTGQGAVGLNHRWVIAPGLRMNLAYERRFGNSFGSSVETAAGQQFLQAYAVGQSASSLGLLSGSTYSVGIEYTDNPDFRASARIEHRDSPQGDNTVLSASAAGKINSSWTGLLRFRQSNFANQTITGALGDTASLKLGVAYRNPKDDTFNGLFSYEYRKNPSTTPETLLFATGSGSEDHTLAVEGIYSPSFRWEFYGKYAMRQTTSFLAQDLTFDNMISLAQLRATYRLGYRWDLTGEARFISQPAADYSETGFAFEAGYYVTPDLRLSLGYSFGRANDGSFGGVGARSDGGVYAGVTLKVNELLNGFGVQKPLPPEPEEEEEIVANSQPKAVLTSSKEGISSTSNVGKEDGPRNIQLDDL